MIHLLDRLFWSNALLHTFLTCEVEEIKQLSKNNIMTIGSKKDMNFLLINFMQRILIGIISLFHKYYSSVNKQKVYA